MSPITTTPFPGNAYASSPGMPRTRLPFLDFIYRLECTMSGSRHPVGGLSGTRMVLPIAGGTVRGPNLSGTIVEMSGADWLTSFDAGAYSRLDARYTLKTDDGHYIYVRSKGIFYPQVPPNGAEASPREPPTSATQDEVDWFTRLQLEAVDDGPYGWLNRVFAIGVLTMHDSKIIIDAYKVTNFPGQMIGAAEKPPAASL